jgi:hypothetical protein
MAPAKKSSLKKAPAKRALALTTTPLLKRIRGASHVGYDRVVFEFDGPVPVNFDVSFVPEIIGDPSGLPVPVIGQALLGVTFSLANGHDEDGNVFTDAITTLGLKNVIQVVRSGDFEAVLSFGIGLAKQTQFSVFTLTNPSRVVIDIKATFTTVPTQIFFVDSHAFAIGQGSYVRAVLRQVIPPNVGARSLNWLFAGPTPDERAGGLTFVNSDATGFTNLTISNGIARVRLVGGANSHGSTLTIANEIMPILKQFPTVTWVKIYDQNGQTETPTGQSDSIPAGLEP